MSCSLSSATNTQFKQLKCGELSLADHDEQVGVVSREHGNVHGNPERVGFVQANAKVPLSTQEQEDEHADVHEAHTSCRWSGEVDLFLEHEVSSIGL